MDRSPDRPLPALHPRHRPTGYVFHRHGRPLHPKNVLDHFHLLCDKAGVPRAARTGVDDIAWLLDKADREESGAPVCRVAQQHPRPHRRRSANCTPRLDDPTDDWPMWSGHHHATTT
ncbi:hypothetical protein [Kitasatospora sp. NPDC088134]|uniref:hypothetical protein n=1 Tax=Kitasatospora sp. NPDC088134 TaxID=3364071 RepID=UPI00382C2459